MARPPRPLPPHIPMMAQMNGNWISDEPHYRKEDPCLELQREVIEGHSLLILQRIDKSYLRYFVGVEMARLLRQQTYNMYRSMKSRGIELIRANQNVLSYLRQQKAVPRNTHSVTLVPYTEGMKFILERLREKQKMEKQNQATLGLLSSPPTPVKSNSAPAITTPPKSATPPPTSTPSPSASHFSSFPVMSVHHQGTFSRESRSHSPTIPPQRFAAPTTTIPSSSLAAPPVGPLVMTGPITAMAAPPLPPQPLTNFPTMELSPLQSLSMVSVARAEERMIPRARSATTLPPLVASQPPPLAGFPTHHQAILLPDPSQRRGEELKQGWLQLLLNS
uniref:Uncharacterized protein n=1 Tax=Paramoeba aestuarina TaxID=180227 RepID=A0A7S4L119_9EUKA|mmetsp:Transcript_29672/g.45846  ORF Transcript_29672/g.45846 Transcript_29672/m.45846 type:complete len:334 (+) Transcript_29672:103-1104(+)